jgi:prevent-host-death family protein
MFHTHVRAIRDLRNHYPELAALVKNHDQIIITNRGKSDTVLIAYEDYAKYEEFLHTRYIVEELAKTKEQAAAPDADWLSADVFFQKARTL